MASGNATQGKPVRVLSLDGGGVRGLSSIIILKQIMGRINEDRSHRGYPSVEPWQVFDLIGGTSTGGLIAVMLGRLRMSLDDCEKAYLELSKKIFTPKWSNLNFHRRALDVLQLNGRFDSNILAESMKECIKRVEGTDDAVLNDSRSECKVFVVTSLGSDLGTTLLRSYTNTKQYERFYEDCRIWEACRATSAATNFFDPIEIGRYKQKFIDGGLGCNNPIREVEREALEIFPGRKPFILTIGTGCAPNTSLGGYAILSLLNSMKALVTETERTAEDFLTAHSSMVDANLLFRFNVNQGLKEVGLEEYKETGRIASATQLYLRTFEINRKLIACVGKLAELLYADDPALHIPEVQPFSRPTSVLYSSMKQHVIPELRSQEAIWNLREDPISRPETTWTPIASPSFVLDDGLQAVSTSTPSFQSAQWNSMPISPPLSSPGAAPDHEMSRTLQSEYHVPTPLIPSSSFYPPEEAQSSRDRPHSTSTIGLNQLTPGSRLTVSSTSSLPHVNASESIQRAGFNAKFISKLRDGSKSSTQIILAWLRNSDIRARLDSDTFNAALLILSKNHPLKKYGGRWIETLEAILDCSPDLECRDTLDIDFTPLTWAVWYKHHEVVEVLITRGASIASTDRFYLRTPLHWAAKVDSKKAAIIIVNSMENLSPINDTDKDGNTAFAIATSAGKNTETAKVLRKVGADLRGRIGTSVQPAELG